MNPFELAREELHATGSAEQVHAGLDSVLREGFEADGRHYRVFGARRGPSLTMSLGMPVLGGGAPVLRGRLREGSGPVVLDVSVGARLEVIAMFTFWTLVTVMGGGYQLYLQSVAASQGRVPWSAVVEVLPGIGVMVMLLLLGAWLFRRRARRDTDLLLDALRAGLEIRDQESFMPVPHSLPDR